MTSDPAGRAPSHPRPSRRAMLRGGALTLAGGAAYAVACGSDSNTDTRSEAQRVEQAQQSISARTDTSAQATPGGIYQGLTNADVTNLDPLTSPSFTAAVAGMWVYSRLLKFKPGFQDKAATGEVESDLATRWEQPDPLRLILHLNPAAVFDARPPTNRRPVDADDVVFSWKRFEAGSVARSNVANSVSPAAPIKSIEAVDKQTVAVNLAFPYAPIGTMLAFSRNVQIMPREAEGGFDPRNEMRGSGAWQLANYQRSIKLEWRKNPDWFIKDRPYLDGWDQPIISEYAAQLAQFRAKRIWSMTVRQEDIVSTKKDLPELVLQRNDFERSCYNLYFGIRPDSPFNDERVRRAASMLIDRDQWIEGFYDVSKFKAEGYTTDVRWHSNISSGWEGYWVDPRSDDMGEGKANFQYNPAEAKKLLAAAGYPNGVACDFVYITSSQYGTTFPHYAEVFKGMLEAHGDFKFRLVNPEYQTEFLPRYNAGRGDFDGIYVGATTTYPDVDGALYGWYHKAGSQGHIALKGQGGDERSFSMIEAQRKELDPAKRIEIIKEWQRYTATKMPILPFPGQSRAYSLAWPWVGNRGVYRDYHFESDKQETHIHLWFDKSKFTG